MRGSYADAGPDRLRCARWETHDGRTRHRDPRRALGRAVGLPSLGTARMADGTILRTIRWEPVEPSWAVAEIVHGQGEHGGRYANVATALTGAGIDTWAYDLRGQRRIGRAARLRRTLVDPARRPGDPPDDAAGAEPREAPGPVRPLARRAGVRRLRPVGASRDCCPTCSCSARPAWTTTSRAGSVRPHACSTGSCPACASPAGIPGRPSRDPAVDEAFAADPLCSSTATVHWGAEVFREQDRLQRAAARPVGDAGPDVRVPWER